MKPVKKALRDKKSAGNSQERTSKHSSYRDDHKKEGKGAGKKGGKDKGKKETHGETDKKPCRFYNTAGGCTRGSKCPFFARRTGRLTAWRGSRTPTPQCLRFIKRWRESCFDTAVLEDGQPKVQDPVWTTKALKQPGWKEKLKKGSRNNRAGNNHRGKPLHDLESWSELTSLDQLPKKWWKLTENSKGRYQYQTEVKILGRYVGCLLDGCAGCNSVTEELVVGAVKAALKDNIPAHSSEFPVAQLECWPKEEVVMGLANGAPINLKGAAVIRVTFPDVTGKKDREILVRAKIIAEGCSTWQGLILGGRALDAVERGGLGFRPGANAHIFDALGVRLPRKEETEEYAEHAYPHVAVQKSLFERAWDKESEVRGSFHVLWQGALGW